MVANAKLRIVIDNTIPKTDYEQLLDFCATLDRGVVPKWKAIMLLNLTHRLPDLIEDEDRGPAWVRRVLAGENLSEVGYFHVYTWLRDHARSARKPYFA
ncbi:hypothetical protein [Mesorhizobium sp. SP-1A]|uniref:hypothetical protein n=1 Tax=Mesorhizobium sp. SP-1A TaxID=3077840 RepID=UPI0028F6D778|nr:hypothetical protein [Mesorhizobium sp. SP-1A]